MSAATELELESELEGESGIASELEHELGLAHELASEFELEHEHEAEHEAFFNHLAAMADRSGRSQALRRIALAAARSALKAQARPWRVVEGEGELGEHELEGELGEHELEASAAQLRHAFAEMEHEGHAAAEAANEQEAAEHFLPLIGLAAKFVLPKVAGFAARKLGGMVLRRVGGRLLRRAGGRLLRRFGPRLIRRVTPQLTRGIANITRTLFRNRSTRPLIHAIPRIARGTLGRLATQIARGRPITPQMAIRTLAQQTARTLSNPRTLARTYRRSRAYDRRYHHHARRVLGAPAGAPVRAADDAAAAGVGQPVMPMGAAGIPGVPYSAGPVPVANGGWMGAMPNIAAPMAMAQPAAMAMAPCPTCRR